MTDDKRRSPDHAAPDGDISKRSNESLDSGEHNPFADEEFTQERAYAERNPDEALSEDAATDDVVEETVRSDEDQPIELSAGGTDKAEQDIEDYVDENIVPVRHIKVEAANKESAFEDDAEGDDDDSFDATQPRRRLTVGRVVWKTIPYFVGLGLIAAMVGAAAAGFFVMKLNRELPDYQVLARYEPSITTRVHAGDGALIAEFARERRIFVPIGAIPDHVKEAFIAAEDKTFYEHGGLDFMGIGRAVLINATAKLSGSDRLVGASTITQQVAKNFLLTSEQTVTRKVKEQLISRRIERAFTKDEILELYLNEIYLGNRSYGVASAALNYFDKGLSELTLDEAAYLAALPKGPNNYHPTRKKDRAVARRNWVIDQMARNGFVSESQATLAKQQDLVATDRPAGAQFAAAEYFAEEVRRDLYDIYGDEALYDGGLSVRTTVDMRLQEAARKALRNGLVDYDRRHGWRGPFARIEIDGVGLVSELRDFDLRAERPEDEELVEAEAVVSDVAAFPAVDDVAPEAPTGWMQALNAVDPISDIDPWRMAVVLRTGEAGVMIGLRDGAFGFIPMSELEWARKWLPGEKLGPKVEFANEVLVRGDVIYVEAAGGLERGFTRYGLRQIPEVNGGIVAIDPHTGRVLAMIGGFSFQHSQFNRATQAMRQPGSAFKPFVYAAALDNGYAPSSLILDAPFVADMGLGKGFYKPQNYTERYYGESTMRLGIEKSRNAMTVRLAQDMGMRPIVENALRFNIVDDMDPLLAMALGAGETTPMRLTTAYAMLVNGGKRIEPVLIDRIQDRTGATIYRHDKRVCLRCNVDEWDNEMWPELADLRESVIDPRTAYQMTSMLEGVVQRGTGRTARSVGKPLAGKTGTTDEAVDAWFVGFSPDLAVGVFVGFDRPRSLGDNESGGKVAAPIFRDFMQAAIGGKPGVPFRIPEGIRLVRVNAQTGLPAQPGDREVILEAFKAENNLLASNQRRIGDRKDQDLGGLY